MISTAIVHQEGSNLFTTSEAIAEGSGIQHKNALELIDRSTDDLSDFGRVAFETRAFTTLGGQQSRRIARLNEQQATLVLTYLRNTPQVREFKKALVKAFYEMAQALQERDSDPAVVMARGLEAAQLVITQKDQRIAELAPRAKFADTFLAASGDYDTRDTAQILRRDYDIKDIGQNRLRDWMQSHRWIDKKRRPYQDRVDAGHLRLKPSSFRFRRTNGEEQLADPQLRVTPRGIEALARAMNREAAA